MYPTIYKLLILSLLFVSGRGIPLEEKKDEVSNWILVPADDGTPVNYTIAEFETLQQNSERKDPSKSKFELFTRQNPTKGQQVISGNTESLLTSNFNSKRPTRIITHGWLSNGHNFQSFRDKYLERGDYNVFLLDWTAAGATSGYVTAKVNVANVGEYIANFVDFLCKHGLSTKDVYLLGHSLGAHVMGIAGKKTTCGRINTIIGLDPAGPLYTVANVKERLDADDAEYVETIHTCAGWLGFEHPIGQANFYPNGGSSQPGCGIDIGTCSHSRSYQLFLETLNKENDFHAVECTNLNEAKNGKCTEKYDGSLKMGGDPSNHAKNLKGIFYLKTNSKSPYGLGYLS